MKFEEFTQLPDVRKFLEWAETAKTSSPNSELGTIIDHDGERYIIYAKPSNRTMYFSRLLPTNQSPPSLSPRVML